MAMKGTSKFSKAPKIGALLSNSLVSYQGHSLGLEYPSTEMLPVNSTAPDN